MVRESQNKNFEFAIFDTFIAEEFYGHYLQNYSPNTMRILDTQDLHSLRKARQKEYERIKDFEGLKMSKNMIHHIKNDVPLLSEKELKNDDYHLREMASIYKSDIIWCVSDFEQKIISEKYSIKNSCLFTFFYDKKDIENALEMIVKGRKYCFERRTNYVWVGNFKHPPNVDQAELLIKEVYPKIRERVSGQNQEENHVPELHIYGSNFSSEIKNICLDQEGVKAKGLMPTISRLRKYRVLLAPMMFGAGIKGKISDSWINSCPVVTTSIGSEGLLRQENGEEVFGGYGRSDEIDDFIQNSVDLYQNKEIWVESVKNGIETINSRLSYDKQKEQLKNLLELDRESCLDHFGVVRDQKDRLIQRMLLNEGAKKWGYLRSYINNKSNDKFV